jgi:transposase
LLCQDIYLIISIKKGVLQNTPLQKAEADSTKSVVCLGFLLYNIVVKQNIKLLEHNKFERKFQQLTLPMNMEIQIPEDDPARLASAQLEELDYRKLYRAYSSQGRKSAAEPRIIFEVLVYGYMCGIYSTRKLEEACRRRVDFMWLLQGEPVPDYTTFARFRSGRTKEAVEDLFYQFVLKLEEMGETEHSEVFIDGTKIESMANCYTFIWRKTTEKYLAKVKKQAKEEFANKGIEGNVTLKKLHSLVTTEKVACEKANIKFVHGIGRRKTPEQHAWEKINDLLARWEDYEKKLFTMGNTRNSYSKTDPDATFMHMKEDHMRNGQLKPGYNVQIAVNSEYITGVAAFPNRTDSGTLQPFLRQIERKHRQKYQAIVADAGYESLDNYLYLEENNQTSFIKPINYEAQKTKKFKTQIGRRENMQYNEQMDCYICAEGRTLHFRRECTQLDRQGRFKTMAFYRCENCTDCQHRAECCKAKDDVPKEIKVSTELLRLSRQSQENIMTPEGILLRINRSIQVEGAFGVLKSDRKFKRFLMRGRTNISTELFLLCMAFDLRKLWSKCNTGRLKTHLFAVQKE